MQSKVSLVKCRSYQPEEVFASIRKSIDLLGGITRYVKPGQRILLKPNMLFGKPPEFAITTHPEILRAVIILVKEFGGVPYVGDSPGYEDPYKAAEICGYKKVCAATGTPIVKFEEVIEVKNPEGRRFKSYLVAKEAMDADVIINLPKFKSHIQFGITSAVKNMFGCVPGFLKTGYHVKVPNRDDFAELLIDVCYLFKPALSIVDAVIAGEGPGGAGGADPKKLGFIAVSCNPVAVDQVICQAVGIEPMQLPVHKAASKFFLVPDRIEVLGEKVKDVKCQDYKKIELLPESVSFFSKPINQLLKNVFTEKPVVNENKCISCRICEQVCLSRAI